MEYDWVKVGVSREAYDKLKIYIDLLLKWNRSLNLVSESSESIIWQRHVLDSLQLLPLLGSRPRIFDLGCGAGFPGLPLAILGIQNINLVEIDVRKCAFLRKIQSILGLDIIIHNTLIKEVGFVFDDCVVSRALWSVSKFCKYLFDSEFQGDCFLLKGQKYQSEIDEALMMWRFNYEITKKHSVILKLSNIKKL